MKRKASRLRESAAECTQPALEDPCSKFALRGRYLRWLELLTLMPSLAQTMLGGLALLLFQSTLTAGLPARRLPDKMGGLRNHRTCRIQYEPHPFVVSLQANELKGCQRTNRRRYEYWIMKEAEDCSLSCHGRFLSGIGM